MVTFQGKSMEVSEYDDIWWHMINIWMKIYMKWDQEIEWNWNICIHPNNTLICITSRYVHRVRIVDTQFLLLESLHLPGKDAFVEHLYTAQPEGRKQSIDSISIRLVTSMHSVWKKTLVIFVDFPYAALCCWALNRLIMVTLLLAVWAVLAVELLLLGRKWSGRQMWFPLISYGDPLKMTDLICTEADWNSLIWLMSDNWISISRSVPLMPLLLRHDTAQEVHQDKPICLEARCFVCFSSGRQRGCKIAVLEVHKYCTIAVDEVIIVNSWSDMAIRMSAESLGSVQLEWFSRYNSFLGLYTMLSNMVGGWLGMCLHVPTL